MDLKKFESVGASTVSMELRDPSNGEILVDEKTSKPVSIKLVSADSKEYRLAFHKQTNLRINRQSKRSARVHLTSEGMETDQIEILARCTKGWSGIMVDKVDVEFSEQAARDLYTRFPWISEQVDDFINDRANFLGN